MINKVKELRLEVPVPMTEALQLLKENDGDVEKCVYLFKVKSIRYICQQTGCDEATANKYYEAEKFDINRAISFVRDEIYDRNYQPIAGVTVDTLRTALQWVKMAEVENFTYSLDYKYLQDVILTLGRIPQLEDVSLLLQKAKDSHNRIFAGYSDSLPMEDFVRRHRKMDDDADFIEANTLIPVRLAVIGEELLRHLRNVKKED